MIEVILPATVVGAESVGDPPDVPAHPAEELLLASATARRRAEFTAARACGRNALAQLGFPAQPILRDSGGAPRWPAGVHGSITHCARYRAAAAGLAAVVRSVGIDAEPHLPLRPGLLEMISTPRERTLLHESARARPEVHWDRLLFSAKESVYKAWFPLTGRWLDFDEAELSFEPDTGTFSASLRVPAPELARPVLTGRWMAANGFALTTVVVAQNGEH